MYVIDTHAHVIPMVDDGSETEEMSLCLLLSAYEQNVRVIFATPHSYAFDNDPDSAADAFLSLRRKASRFFPDVRFYLGCEVMCEANKMDEVLHALHTGKYPSMNHSRFVLMEFSRWVMPENTLPCIERLLQEGWIPIIAHMEKYENLRGRMDLVDQFRSLGCLIQMNVYSVSEEMNPAIVIWARELAREQKIDFLGTDMHRTNDHPPSVTRGLLWLEQNCDQDYVEAIAFGNAQRLLTGERS